jgi:hypothetical protein
MKPIGYTVGKFHYKLSQYEKLSKWQMMKIRFHIDDYEAGYNKRKYFENELTDILRAGVRDVQPSRLRHDEILYRASIDY